MDQVVNDIIDGKVRVSTTSYQDIVSQHVKEANEAKKKALLKSQVQQLRLRQPNMVKKEYYNLLHSVQKEPRDDYSGAQSESRHILKDQILGTSSAPNLQNASHFSPHDFSYQNDQQSSGLIREPDSMQLKHVRRSMANPQPKLRLQNTDQVSKLKQDSNTRSSEDMFVTQI